MVLAAGRLGDGRSFAFSLKARGKEFFSLRPESASLPPSVRGAFVDPDPWQSFEGLACTRLFLPPGLDFPKEESGRENLRTLPAPSRPAWDLFAELGIGVCVDIEGEARPGNAVDLYFAEPSIAPDTEDGEMLFRWLALDIETDRDSRIVAISLACDGSPAGRLREVLFLGPETGAKAVRSFATEADLLVALAIRLRKIDPDVITGWNVIDFDFRLLCSRYEALGLPFRAARTALPVSFSFAGGNVHRGFVTIQGRVVLDAMRLVRGLGIRFEDQSLDTVARRILGLGKTVSERGEDKLARLEALRRDEPAAFCAYCLADSSLVLSILEATKLAALSMKRSVLTGTSLDIAWTSIPVFERVYGAELRRRRIVPLARSEREVSGAAGGTILDPVAGLFENVLVFDFRSLYPSIMRSFNIDPFARARAMAHPRDSDILAPNGARFAREEGIMPSLIRNYAAEREKALASGDDSAAYVLKILQNSFYGVLGSTQCAYARTDLAGAITSFGRKFLHASRDWFESGGRRVLYGDTDSVFVQALPADGSGYSVLSELGSELAGRLDAYLSELVRTEYGLESFLRIRCEKVYGRFLIPRLRMDDGGRAARGAAGLEGVDDDAEPGELTVRGRSKGYAGLELCPDGSRVEIKGMEAARSDWTALARRFQTELIGLVFAGGGPKEAKDHCRLTEAELRSGRLDGELVYRKNLRRPVSAYASESPQVKAARLMGWTARRGLIAYVMTRRGPRPESDVDAPIDYGHYVEKQLAPIARSVAGACGWKAGDWFAGSGQIGFDFD